MTEILTASVLSPIRRRRSLIPFVFPAAMLPVFAANAALVYFALQSSPGLVSDRPFEEGRTYNREIAAAAAQDELGWTAKLDAPTRAFITSPVFFEVTDRAGAPVTGLTIDLRVWRPVEAAPDIRIRLEEQHPGQYGAELALPLPGQWQLDLTARGSAEEYVIGRRIVVK